MKLMDKKQLEELMALNESNKTIEATFFELQNSMTLIAKQMKFLYDECISNGFTEDQSLKIAITFITGKGG